MYLALLINFMRSLYFFATFLLGLSIWGQPSLKQILDSPFASNLIVTKDGKKIAWVDNIAGERNIFIATGEKFSSVRRLTAYVGDQGISLSNLKFTADDKKLIYVRGNKKNEVGEPANPALLQEERIEFWEEYD